MTQAQNPQQPAAGGAAPFVRNAFIAKPGIVGAQWWQESVQAPVARRAVLVAALIGGAGIVGVGTIFAIASSGSSSSTPEVSTVTKTSLDMQREYGWNFGAATDDLKLDAPSARPVDAAVLQTMHERMRPKQARHQPYYQATLFQAPSALPRSVPAEDAQPVKPLSQAIRPVMTPPMKDAYLQGRSLASLFDSVGKDTAVIVDLPGPDSVAFAAGASNNFEPVFLFDNWPHPKGVVASHLTLASALTFDRALAKGAAARGAKEAPAMFVLDRNRLATYTDEANQFDNRYVAKVPDAARLKAMGYKNVLYVVPSEGTVDLDDLNEDFVAYQQASIPVRIVAAPAFARDPAAKARAVAEEDREYDDGSTYSYGGSDTTHTWFWTDYGLGRAPRPGARPPSSSNSGKSFVPTPRRTAYSSGTTATSSPGARPRPSGFGTTAVVVAAGTGLILGSRLSRSGSWNRSGGSAFG
jgi:hypothetical protein